MIPPPPWAERLIQVPVPSDQGPALANTSAFETPNPRRTGRGGGGVMGAARKYVYPLSRCPQHAITAMVGRGII